jgi:glycosyltransferase involved in cell wall biosynthesis
MRYVWDPPDQREGLHRLAGLGPRAALRRWDRHAARWVDSFAANSTEVQRRIERCYGRASRVIHPPVDTEFFTPAPDTADASDTGSRPGEPFVLACSRFIPYKRLDIAIRAAEHVGIPIVVAGSGPGEEALRRLAAQVRVPVTFEVSSSNQRLRALYRNAAALVFPALEDFGIVAVEAQACGTPVVALATGGTVDTVIDGVTGVLVGSQELHHFARGIERALELSNADACVRNARKFSYGAFEANVRSWVSEVDRERR